MAKGKADSAPTGRRRVTREEIGQPQLRPEDLGGASAAVLTIAEAEERASRFGSEEEGKPTARVVLRFAEVEGRELWLGKKAKNALIDHYGDDLDGWIGKRVPLVAVFTSVGGKQQHVVQVAEDFDGVLKAASRSAGGKKR